MQGSSKEEESLDGLGSTTIEQICEENIQLFMKYVIVLTAALALSYILVALGKSK